MAERGAPEGNQNSSKQNRWWGDTLRRVLLQEDGKKLRALAEKLVARAEEGDIAALKEIGDRLDGKPAQAIIGGEEDDPPIKVSGVIELRAVYPKNESGS